MGSVCRGEETQSTLPLVSGAGAAGWEGKEPLLGPSCSLPPMHAGRMLAGQAVVLLSLAWSAHRSLAVPQIAGCSLSCSQVSSGLFLDPIR